ncbi:MAG: hypothetical protein R2820_04570 [Cyclobacteriaceae bacterium]|nr:hypothetical protein [Cyclobacteriaceae bacterium]
MNLIKTLQSDFSKQTVNKIVAHIGNDPARFKTLVDAFLAGHYRTTQRAAWPLSYCVKAHPELIKPHLKNIIKNLDKPGIHDAVKRNTVRFLQFIDIPKSMHGITLDACFPLLENKKEPIAIRVFAMTVLANLADTYPEIKGELIAVIEDQMPYGSAGFISRGKKILKKLKA